MALSALVAACSPLTLVNLASPSARYAATPNIAYGDHPRQRIDVYRPKAAAEAPVVVFFYGGGWRSGDRSKYRFVASALTGAGFVVMIPDYRLFPEVEFPQFMEDGAAAVAWVAANREDYGGNGQVFLMGHSAGAHIAALLALDRRYLATAGASELEIAGLVGLSGPYDFLPFKPDSYLHEVFPDPQQDQGQPINFVTDQAPPTLLIHGTGDDVVRPKNSESLATALANAGVPVQLKLYDGMGHTRVVGSLAPPLGFLGDTLEDTLEFLMAP